MYDCCVDPKDVRVTGIECLYHDGDDHDDGNDNKGVEEREEEAEDAVPAYAGVRAPDHALREEEVDDEQNHDTGGREDLGGDSEGDVGWYGGGRDSHDAGHDSCHAET